MGTPAATEHRRLPASAPKPVVPAGTMQRALEGEDNRRRLKAGDWCKTCGDKRVPDYYTAPHDDQCQWCHTGNESKFMNNELKARHTKVMKMHSDAKKKYGDNYTLTDDRGRKTKFWKDENGKSHSKRIRN